MLARALLNRILEDEAMTRHLGDAEARVLVEWLVERAEHLGEVHAGDQLTREVKRLWRRGRGIARFVGLWCQENGRGPASQLAASEGFLWPLPPGPIDPCELMEEIIEQERLEQARRPA
jgi:hypothetical protein